MSPSASQNVKWHLKRHLPSVIYDFLATRHRAWKMKRQTSAWRTEQISIALQSGQPHLTSSELDCFYSELKRCKTYLEYGSGGSTLAAVEIVPNVVSVENDRAFYRAVTSKARSLSKGHYIPVFVYTGRTSAWGAPTVRRPTPLNRWLWLRYASAPWMVLERKRLLPDLILIDGRFRVACALESLLRLPSGSACRILLDDFEQYNGAYFPIFEFVEAVERHGRAVIFRPAADFDRVRCRAVLEYSYADFR